ncbi:DNA polymerase III subunit delta' [Gallaecimonas kandeliae]|uniref:DNA polymerase III subunit delta' n=1 Tax=Gallaecimonas kandeliae TaxID=3029055 RepID=UPI002649E435|nr:DNA polymerase III subunit delta' [Gallaecimonas kandeliae]WKE67384.1 DNA polymerase III subunit delta' [Gallaecimonas kandeliae]
MLPWLAPFLDQFGQWQAQGRLAHAYLLTGPAGVGKGLLADALAQRLLCSNGIACGQCHGCHLFRAGTHPDLHRVEPDNGSIKVDAIRALMGPVYGAPLLGGAKVVIMNEADSLNLNAANALLKSLEEPPAGTFWLLASSRPGQLLPTILSRCQQLHLPAPLEAEALAWLQGQGIGASVALLRRFHGAPLALKAALETGYQDKVAKLQADLVALETRHLFPEQFADRWHKEALLCLDELAHRLLDQARLARGLPPLYHERLDRQELLDEGALTALWQSVLGSRKLLLEQPAINSKWLLMDIAWQLTEGRSDSVVG